MITRGKCLDLLTNYHNYLIICRNVWRVCIWIFGLPGSHSRGQEYRSLLQTTQIPLDRKQPFVKRLVLGDTFIILFLYLYHGNLWKSDHWGGALRDDTNNGCVAD